MTRSTTIEEAFRVVRRNPDAISVALLQRHLRLGYNAALKLMANLIAMGVVIDKGTVESGCRYQLTSSLGNQT